MLQIELSMKGSPLPANTSQVRSVWSHEADASSGPVGLKASPATGPSCPDSTWTSISNFSLQTTGMASATLQVQQWHWRQQAGSRYRSLHISQKWLHASHETSTKQSILHLQQPARLHGPHEDLEAILRAGAHNLQGIHRQKYCTAVLSS